MTEKPDAKTVLNPQWPGGMTMDELIQVLAPVGIPCAHCGRLDLHDGMCPIPFMQQASRQLAASQARVEAMMLHKLAPSLSGPPECLDFAGRVTPYGAAYAEGYRARQAEIEAAALSAGEEQRGADASA